MSLLRWRCCCPLEDEDEEEEGWRERPGLDCSQYTINEGFNSKVEIQRAVNIVFLQPAAPKRAIIKHDLETDVCHE